MQNAKPMSWQAVYTAMAKPANPQANFNWMQKKVLFDSMASLLKRLPSRVLTILLVALVKTS